MTGTRQRRRNVEGKLVREALTVLKSTLPRVVVTEDAHLATTPPISEEEKLARHAEQRDQLINMFIQAAEGPDAEHLSLPDNETLGMGRLAVEGDIYGWAVMQAARWGEPYQVFYHRELGQVVGRWVVRPVELQYVPGQSELPDASGTAGTELV